MSWAVKYEKSWIPTKCNDWFRIHLISNGRYFSGIRITAEICVPITKHEPATNMFMFTGAPFNNVTFIIIWISNCIHYNEHDEITLSSQISTIPALKFGNFSVVSSHIIQECDHLFILVKGNYKTLTDQMLSFDVPKGGPIYGGT